MADKAIICHQTTGRLRIKIPGRREDIRYFSNLRSEFRDEDYNRVAANPFTGSLVLEADRIDVDGIATFASSQGLFELDRKKPEREPLFKKVVNPVSALNAGIDRISGGDFNLPGVIFMVLLGFGATELIRGNFRTPPWYTAFWYAFGVFSKSLIDKK